MSNNTVLSEKLLKALEEQGYKLIHLEREGDKDEYKLVIKLVSRPATLSVEHDNS